MCELDVDLGSGHTAYCCASLIDLYHIKFCSNWKKGDVAIDVGDTLRPALLVRLTHRSWQKIHSCQILFAASYKTLDLMAGEGSKRNIGLSVAYLVKCFVTSSKKYCTKMEYFNSNICGTHHMLTNINTTPCPR